MKLLFPLILATLLIPALVRAQEFDKSINKDSLFEVILKRIPEGRRSELVNAYRSGNESTKEFLLFMLSLPQSSKKQLIANIDSNYAAINHLIQEYDRLVPANYTVMIEFKPADKLVHTPESIDMRIDRRQGKEIKSYQEWNMTYRSDTLMHMLGIIGWKHETLTTIKRLLSAAHCISVENGESSEIGYARSGMGKYSYILFNKNLTADEIKRYNNGCTHIFYKKNIVLEYGGGAVGPQCFPD